mgnify:FL=1
MRRYFYILVCLGVFFVWTANTNAAVDLRALPPDCSQVQIGQTIDYSWDPISARDNCVGFYRPGASGWDDWLCLGRRIGSYSKSTAGLPAGKLSARVAIRKCSFFGFSCSWDYSNTTAHNLLLSPPPPPPSQQVTADIKANGSDTEISVRPGTAVDITWSSVNAASCDITPCSFSFPNTCQSPNGSQRSVISQTTDFTAVCYSSDGSEVSQRDTIRVVAELPKNTLPSVTSKTPQAPADYCVSPLTWTLSWNFSDPDAGSFQSAYQIRIFDASNGREVLSRLYYSSSQSFAVPAGALAFNKTYSWKIKVWDNEYATAESDGFNFTTLAHRPPKIDFYWRPFLQRLSAGETINLYDDTNFYDTAPPRRQWNWILPAGMTALSPTDTYNISAKAERMGIYNITLQATDSEDLTCSATKNITIGRSVPTIKEVIPR